MSYWVEDESQYVGIICFDNSKDRITIRIEKRKFNINFAKSSTESEEKNFEAMGKTNVYLMWYHV